MFKSFLKRTLQFFVLLLYSITVQAQFPDVTMSSGEIFDLSSGLKKMNYLDDIGLRMMGNMVALESTVDAKTYTLGPQDIISINIDGENPINLRGIIVSPEGKIFLPGMGVLQVDGLTVSDASDMIGKHILKFFTHSKVQVSLEVPRRFFIFVKGNVPFPGKHLVGAQTRVDQALYQAIKGPVNIGGNSSVPAYNIGELQKGRYSLRNVTLIRENTDTLSVDLLSYFMGGILEDNVFVQSGDIIHISRMYAESPRISISGAVNIPLEIEFRQGDTIERLLLLSGGLTSFANENEAYIIRKTDNKLQRISVSSSDFTTGLLPNDRVVIPNDERLRESASAWIMGEVSTPGNYPIAEGFSTVNEMIELSGGITKDALKKGIYIIRDDAMINREFDEMDDALFWNRDLLRRTGNTFVQGMVYLEAEATLNRNTVFVDLSDSEKLSSFTLRDGDKILVPRDRKSVMVLGQVNKPGLYPLSGTASVDSFIDGAEGFALSANTKDIYVIKAGSKVWKAPSETKLESGDIIFVDRIPVEELNAKRQYDLAKGGLMNARISLILSAISTTVLILNFVSR